MSRARHATPAPTAKAARRGRAAPGLEDLAVLRGRLKAPPPADDDSRPSGDTPRTSPASSEPADDAALLRASLRDVAPLPKRAARAELDRPKPPPVPRPHAAEPAVEGPAPAHRRTGSLEGTALFRSAMDDVTPLRRDARADPGRPVRTRPIHDTDRDPATAGGEAPPLLLPPDPDATPPGELFRYAVRGAQPIDRRNRAELEQPAPPPEPRQRCEDEHAALRESLEAPLTFEDRLEMGDEAVFLRPGLPRRVLTDLRRGRWVLQAELDLHGYNREEARGALAAFLAASLQRGHRCVRVIHGKGLGSPGKLSILKQLSRGWLAQRDEILAFCQAGPHAGGSGALLVLLKGRVAVRDGGNGEP